MASATNTPWGGTFRPGEELPRLFAIIYCAFPWEEEPDQPKKDRCRRCLVLGIQRFMSLKCWALEMVYGTSQRVYDTHDADVDLIIRTTEEAEQMGLSMPTRFELGRRLWIPWCTDFFENNKPRGYLTPHYRNILELCLQKRAIRPASPVPLPRGYKDPLS
jgi:hypothetical protein